MLTEQSAYTNRWRAISPSAKGIFTLCGMTSAFVADSPITSLLIALFISSLTIFGAAVPTVRYLRIALPALFFILASALSLSFSVDFSSLSIQLAKSEFPTIAHVTTRSLACLSALLFLALTTPLSDIISLLRRCKTPETMLDLMTLCYRTLFVLSESIHETMTAQSARLGYATVGLSIRSLGALTANLTLQVWHRSQALQLAAESRCNYGALRFMENSYPSSRLHIFIATICGLFVISFAVLFK